MECGAFGPTPRFDSSEPTHLADAGLIRVPPGGWERNIFLPNRCHSIRRLLGLPGPDLGHFLYGQKVTKKPHKGGTLSMGSLPYVSHPHDDTKGAYAPFGNQTGRASRRETV